MTKKPIPLDKRPISKAEAEQITLLYNLNARNKETGIDRDSVGAQDLNPVLIGKALVPRDIVWSTDPGEPGGRKIYWLTDKGAKIAARIVTSARRAA